MKLARLLARWRSRPKFVIAGEFRNAPTLTVYFGYSLSLSLTAWSTRRDDAARMSEFQADGYIRELSAIPGSHVVNLRKERA